jgi:hypothetical protein
MKLRAWSAVLTAGIAFFLASTSAVHPTRVRAQAQDERTVIEQWAERMSTQLATRDLGPRVEGPPSTPRPSGTTTVLRSLELPLAVQAGPRVTPALARRTLDALEQAHHILRIAGWGAPLPDGGAGGTSEFDLYLADGAAHPADAFSDGSIHWTLWDAHGGFGVVDASVPDDALAPCVTSAYAQALLLGVDPAEARTWRRATAEYLAWMVTGLDGCGDAVAAQQQEPWRSPVSNAAGDGAGGALFIAMMTARHDGGTGTFIRELWQAARQRTPAGPRLRGRPDLWEAFDVVSDLAGDEARRAIEEMAVARFHVGSRERERGSPMPFLSGLRSDAQVPILAEVRYSDLPKFLPVSEPALETYGSGYALVDVTGARPTDVLRIWMQAEYGVYWSLVAVVLGPDGRELTRVSAPHRTLERSYLVIERLAEAEKVLIVVTNLSNRVPDADAPDENVRAFRVIVGKEPGTEPAQES